MAKVFFLEPTHRQRQYLRRYRSGEHKCAATGRYCNAMFFVGIAGVEYTADGYIKSRDDLAPSPADPRWPLECEACGTPFSSVDPFQLFGEQIYRRLDTGEETTLRAAPAGAVWNAWWIADRRSAEQRGCGFAVGPDGRSLVVRLPDGHDWMIDSRARNCTKRDDAAHFCWVRHGRPEDGTLHVDKNGNTCAAAGGSIDTGKWHGFLHNGILHT